MLRKVKSVGWTQILLFILSVLSALNAPASVLAAESSKAPNVVLIMADDLGWSDIGCYGGEMETPHIDSLARQGLRFTQFYNNSICGPTRASLLTGLYCQQVGHQGDQWNQPKNFNKCVTLGEMFQQAGYRTMMVGKWQGRDSAIDRGFHRFYGPMCQAKISYYHEVQGNPYYLDRQRQKLPADFYMTDAFNQHALQFLKESAGGEEPFFLYVAHIAPHWPLHAKESDVARFRERYRNTGWDSVRESRLKRQQEAGLIPASWKMGPRPRGVRDWKSDAQKDWQAERMAVYAAQVAAIDEGVGQLLQALKESGQEENTIVMFLSDNGAAPDGGTRPSTSGFGFNAGTNQSWRKDGGAVRGGSGPDHLPGPPDTFAGYGIAWANASNTPLRGTKMGAYEGGIRTPLVVRWPATIRKAAITQQPGHVIDIMATCLDVAGAEYPTEFQGRRPLPLVGKSLLPILQGREREPHEQLCWRTRQHRAIRRGKWKAVAPRDNGPWQLFDMLADGTETTDLAGQEPQVLEELLKHFEEWWSAVK